VKSCGLVVLNSELEGLFDSSLGHVCDLSGPRTLPR
jgi:hypothetical protein